MIQQKKKNWKSLKLKRGENLQSPLALQSKGSKAEILQDQFNKSQKTELKSVLSQIQKEIVKESKLTGRQSEKLLVSLDFYFKINTQFYQQYTLGTILRMENKTHFKE